MEITSKIIIISVILASAAFFVVSPRFVAASSCMVPIGNSGIWESCEEAEYDEDHLYTVKEPCLVPIGNSGIYESCVEAKYDKKMAKKYPKKNECWVPIGNSGVYQTCTSAISEIQQTQAPVQEMCLYPIGNSGIYENCEATIAALRANNVSSHGCLVEVGNSNIFESCAEAAYDKTRSVVPDPVYHEIGNSGIYETVPGVATSNNSNLSYTSTLPTAGGNTVILYLALFSSITALGGYIYYQLKSRKKTKPKYQTF